MLNIFLEQLLEYYYNTYWNTTMAILTRAML